MSAEPCENCGTPVKVVSWPDWQLWEQIGTVKPNGTAYVPHDPETCRRRRAARHAR